MSSMTHQGIQYSSARPVRRLGEDHSRIAPGEIAIGVIIGRASEYFDFFVFGIASVLVFPSVFFPFEPRLEGTLYAFTVVHVARKGWRTPYVIAYVDLDNGVRVSAPLACDPRSPPPYDARVRLKVGEIGRTDDGRPIMSHQFEPA